MREKGGGRDSAYKKKVIGEEESGLVDDLLADQGRSLRPEGVAAGRGRGLQAKHCNTKAALFVNKLGLFHKNRPTVKQKTLRCIALIPLAPCYC